MLDGCKVQSESTTQGGADGSTVHESVGARECAVVRPVSGTFRATTTATALLSGTSTCTSSPNTVSYSDNHQAHSTTRAAVRSNTTLHPTPPSLCSLGAPASGTAERKEGQSESLALEVSGERSDGWGCAVKRELTDPEAPEDRGADSQVSRTRDPTEQARHVPKKHRIEKALMEDSAPEDRGALVTDAKKVLADAAVIGRRRLRRQLWVESAVKNITQSSSSLQETGEGRRTTC